MKTLKPSCLVVLGALFAVSCSGDKTVVEEEDPGTGVAGGAGGAGGTADGGKAGGAGVAKGGGAGAAGKGVGGSAGGSTGSGGAGGETFCAGTPVSEPVATVPVVPTCTGTPVATAPSDAWVSAAGNLDMSATVTALAAQPCTSMVVAGPWKKGLWATTDSGASWTKLGDTGTAVVNDGSGDTILNGQTEILFDPTTPTTFYESGMYGWQDPWTMGAFVTHDNGVKFVGYLNMGPKMQSHNDSISVDFTDPQRRTILSGGHEQKVSGGEGLFLSFDAGACFDDIMSRLPTDVGFCTLAFVLDSQNLLVGCPSSWSGNPGAIVRSSDAGVTWTKVSDKGSGGQALWASDGTLLWPKENGGLLKSTDQGKTWTAPAGGSNVKLSVVETPNGKLLSASGDHIILSTDHGETWTNIGQPLPGTTDAHFTYSAMAKTLYYTYKGACMKAGWDFAQ